MARLWIKMKTCVREQVGGWRLKAMDLEKRLLERGGQMDLEGAVGEAEQEVARHGAPSGRHLELSGAIGWDLGKPHRVSIMPAPPRFRGP